MGNSQSGCSRSDVEVRQLLQAAEAGDLAFLLPAIAADVSLVRLRSPMGGNTAWHKAAKGRQLGVLEALEAAVGRALAAAPANKEGEEGDAKLRRLGGDAREVVKALINMQNKKGFTPLMMAARRGHVPMATWLLERGADIWARDRWRLQTALHSAVEGGSTELVRLLVNASEGNLQDGVLLLEAGNHAGLTPLHYAAYLGRPDVIKVLFSYRADVAAQTDYFDVDWPVVNGGDTPLHIAAGRGNEEVIKVLLRGYNELSGNMVPGARTPRLRDPRGIRNDYGRLAYHLAMRKGYTHLAEWLDPSVPIRFLLSGEELETTTLYGPPRLATLAARVLHASLKADLAAIQAAAAGACPPTPHLEQPPMVLPGVPLPPSPVPVEHPSPGGGGGGERTPRRWSWGSRQHTGNSGVGGGCDISRPASPQPGGLFSAGDAACQQQQHQQRTSSSGGSTNGRGSGEVVAAICIAPPKQGAGTGCCGAPSEPGGGWGLARSSSSSCDSECCGICLDASPTAQMVPCKHGLCAACGLDLVKRYSVGATVCPFCRALVRSFQPLGLNPAAAAMYSSLRAASSAGGAAPAPTKPSSGRPIIALTATAAT